MVIAIVFLHSLQLLNKMIDVVEKKSNNTGGTITLKCKDFRVISLEIRGTDDFNGVAETLEALLGVEFIELLYPFFYRADFDIIQDGWANSYDSDLFFNKINALDPGNWRVSKVNENFAVCPSYPDKSIVPKSISDESIKVIAKFRSGGRFPVLSYFHSPNGAMLLRSSQPFVGSSNKRCKDDEKMLNTIIGPGKRGFVLDTRPANLAQLAKSKGGGFEMEAHYPLWRRIHRSLSRFTLLGESLAKLIDASNETACSMDKWLNRLESSSWLSHVKETLDAACLVAQCLNEEGTSVLVHGSEGLDGTLQVTSLAQIILDANTRTILGFQQLIEREWIYGGHPFTQRNKCCAYGLSFVASSKSTSSALKDIAPSFILFLDCVFQIHRQFPCSFEFNTDFLILLFKHSYASNFGTFIGNSPKMRHELRLTERTVSLWSWVNRPTVVTDYLNPVYEINNGVIWPSVAPQSIVIWDELYFRWVFDDSAKRKEVSTYVQAIREYENKLKNEVISLRKKLIDLAESNTALL